MKPDFRVYFNQGKQFLNVYVADSPRAFRRKHDCHAMYVASHPRKKRAGLFGSIYLSELNYSPMAHELFDHELTHMLFDWLLCRGMRLTVRNEERIATMIGEVSRRFWRKYERIYGE